MHDWNDLQFLLALSQQGDLASAAESMEVNRTTVSRRISHLEQTLHTKLVERVGRDLVLTDAGRETVATAELIEGEMLHLQRQVYGRDNQLAGAIRLTVTPAIGGLMAPGLIEFQTQHPEVALEVSATMIAEDLATFNADVAIRLTNQPPDDLVGRLLARPKVAIYGSERTARELAQRQQITTIGIARSFPSWTERALGKPSQQVASSNSADVVREMISRGDSVAVLPCYVAEPDPRLVRISDTHQDEFAELWLLYHPRLRKIQRFRVFTDFIVAQFVELRSLFEG